VNDTSFANTLPGDTNRFVSCFLGHRRVSAPDVAHFAGH